MKISKNNLKNIIREEVNKVLEGDRIQFPIDRVSDRTFDNEEGGEVLGMPDPLRNMIDFFDLDQDIDRQEKLRKLFSGPLEGSTDQIFMRAGKMSSMLGSARERVPLAIDALYDELL